MFIIILEYHGFVRSEEKGSLYEAVKRFESLRKWYPGGCVKMIWRTI